MRHHLDQAAPHELRAPLARPAHVATEHLAQREGRQERVSTNHIQRCASAGPELPDHGRGA
jgi:hypothetical protein